MTSCHVRSLRVLFVAPATPAGPTTTFIRSDIAAVERLGVTGRTFLLGPRTSLPGLIRDARRFRKELAEFKPDLVHAHYGTMTAMFCVLLAQQPLVISYQGSDLNPFVHSNRLRSPVGRILSQIAALRASRIICVSRQLKEALWWRQSRAWVIPSGVDTAVFTPLPKREARTSMGWAEQDRIVVSSAGTDPQRKRLDLAQSAVALAERVCGKIRFVVLEGRTEQKDIAVIFSAADCLLLTSDREGSPNIVKEAMACNLPVISVDVGDVRERLRSVHPSSIVTRNPSDIARTLVEFVTSPKRSNGAEMMVDLSAEHAARKVLNLYQEALAHEPSVQSS